MNEISIFLVKQNDILNDLQLWNKYSNLHFLFKCPSRLVKLPLSLAAHPPTPWTRGKVQFVSTLKQQTLVYYIKNALWVKYQRILTLKSHQSTNRMPNRAPCYKEQKILGKGNAIIFPKLTNVWIGEECKSGWRNYLQT